MFSRFLLERLGGRVSALCVALKANLHIALSVIGITHSPHSMKHLLSSHFPAKVLAFMTTFMAGTSLAAVTYSPLIDEIYTDRRSFTFISDLANANGGNVTASMSFSIPVHVEPGPIPGIVSYSGGWAVANDNGGAFNVIFNFSQPITTFSTQLQLNGSNGQSAVEMSGYLGWPDNFEPISTVARSATNPVYADEIDLTYTEASGFDRLVITMTQGPNIAGYWAMQVNVIPEPSTCMLGSMVLAVAAFRRRR